VNGPPYRYLFGEQLGAAELGNVQNVAGVGLRQLGQGGLYGTDRDVG
jgi:hypothetical protein